MREGSLNVSTLRGDPVDTEDCSNDHDISLDMRVEVLSSTHFNIYTHLQVMVDNKKVSKLLKTPTFNQKVKATVLHETYLVVNWYTSKFSS